MAVLLWLAAWAVSEHEERAAQARRWLPRAGYGAGALLLAILLLPIGPRGAIEGNVPDVVGLSAAHAEERLDAANLSARLKDFPRDDDRCRVFRQSPEGGAELDEYGEVNLRCRARIPDVVGDKADAAETRLYDVGFETRLLNEPADYDTTRCRVRKQSKKGRATPDTTIHLQLRCKKPPPPPLVPEPEPIPETEAAPSGGGCDPNYTGCVPAYPPDVDCVDVDGPVEVIGDDVHNLDLGGDEKACELF